MINKLVRTITSILPVDSQRTGRCNRCGECCKLPFQCVFLRTDESGKYSCAAYHLRPFNCRKFPRTPAQLESVAHTCSYSFTAVAEEIKQPISTESLTD
jgi:Fe-S-cluster containining protein